MGRPFRGIHPGNPRVLTMPLTPEIKASQAAGTEMYRLIEDLYPVCRSITGNGVRESLGMIGKHIPLQQVEIPTGTGVFDWQIPKEWNVSDAYIIDPSGKRIVDFRKLNLHLLNYSIPVRKTMPLGELKEHLFTLPDKPALVPYRTSYYKETWGFCISQNQFDSLPEGDYEVVVDTTLEDGHLTYGECLIPGETGEEILISTHICHPSLCNDNLSGIAVATFLAKHIAASKPLYSYRFLFIPGTIGSIAWLSRNEPGLGRIKGGLVITLLGDESGFTYKSSRQEDSLIDRVAKYYFRELHEEDAKLRGFIPYGYDERQYCSPGIDLPVGCLTRNSYGEFPEYHTSADNLQFVKPGKLAESLDVLKDLLVILEHNHSFRNLYPRCEPQLGRRGLYDELGGGNEGKELQLALLWVLNYSDGTRDMLDIAEKSGIDIRVIMKAAGLLLDKKLIERSES
jgi:aminopeptidase-like protein